MPSIGQSRYGKSRIRLVKVTRHPEEHALLEWTIHILFEGAYDEAYRSGDNRAVLPTDTMKNTVYSLAQKTKTGSPEEFAAELVGHFLSNNAEAGRVDVEIESKPWERLADGFTFVRGGAERETAKVSGTRESVQYISGLSGLVMMKTAGSAFEGFRKDPLTTLPEVADRLLGTSLSAEWTYESAAVSFGPCRKRIRETLLGTFARRQSRSVQHTLYAMGEAVLAASPEVTGIKLTMPNLHCLPVDLSRFGQTNHNEIFVPVDEPHGHIEAHIFRD